MGIPEPVPTIAPTAVTLRELLERRTRARAGTAFTELEAPGATGVL